VPGPPAAITTPARAGPPTIPTPSAQFETTFAAVSSAGVRAIAGRSTAWVGRVIVNGIAARIATT
jgi:hypothetical protein